MISFSKEKANLRAKAEKLLNLALNKENYQDYFLVTPCEESIADGYTMTINGSIEKLAEIEDASLTLNFTIQYFYNSFNNIIVFIHTISDTKVGG